MEAITAQASKTAAARCAEQFPATAACRSLSGRVIVRLYHVSVCAVHSCVCLCFWQRTRALTRHSPRCVSEFSQLLLRVRSFVCSAPSTHGHSSRAPAAAAAELRSYLPLLRECTSLQHPLHSAAHDALACIAMRTGMLDQAVVDASESVRLLTLRSTSRCESFVSDVPRVFASLNRRR